MRQEILRIQKADRDREAAYHRVQDLASNLQQQLEQVTKELLALKKPKSDPPPIPPRQPQTMRKSK